MQNFQNSILGGSLSGLAGESGHRAVEMGSGLIGF